MFSRVVLAYVLALPFLVMGLGSTHYNIAVTMSSSVPGMLQVFYFTDSGVAGGTETPVTPGDTSRVYRLGLPPGDYRHLRIDPGTASGRYVIERVALLDADGSIRTVIPLTHLVPNAQITTGEITRRRLALAVAGDDPQLLYTASALLHITATNPMPLWLVARFLVIWGAVVFALWCVELAVRPLKPAVDRVLTLLASAAHARPRHAIIAVACASTIAATYPVLFLGRSFVAPNNGGSPQLYDGPPFTAGSVDLEVEDVRGSDTAATLYEFVPYSRVQRDALAFGELPLWNRHNAAGRPLWGQGMSFLLDPLHWFTMWSPDLSWGWDLKFIAHRFVFALGAGLVAVAVTSAWVPAVLVAAGAPFIGLYAYRLNHPAAFTITYAPWVLLSVLILARASDRRHLMQGAVLLAASASLVLVASTPKETAVMLLGLAIVAMVTFLRSPGTWMDRGRRFAAGAAAAVTALLLTAPHWLIFLSVLNQSIVPPYDKPYALFAGAPHAVALAMSPLMPGPVYPGLHPLFLVLVLAAFCSPTRLLKQPGALGCALSAVVLLVVAFGMIPHHWIISAPFIGNIGHIYDVFVAAALVPLLLLAASGVLVLFTAGSARAATVMIVTGLTAWYLITSIAVVSPPSAIVPWIALSVLALSVALPWTVFQAHTGRSRTLSLAASVAAIIALLLPYGLHASTGAPPIDQLLVQPRLRQPLHWSAPALDAVHKMTTEPARTVGVEWTLVPGVHALYGLEGVGGADALQIPLYEELVGAGGMVRLGSWFTTVTPAGIVQAGPLLDMLNVRALLSRPDLVPPGTAEVSLDGADRLRVLRRESAWPRAFFVDGIIQYSSATDLVRQVAERRLPFAAIQSNDQRALEATRRFTRPSGTVTAAQQYTLTVNTTSYLVRTTGPGVAVLGETFLPDDFHATLNGLPVPYFRVNHAFKGVTIPAAGDWVVKFEYVPPRWRASWTLAGAGAVLLMGLGLAGILRARQSRLDPSSIGRRDTVRPSET